MLESVVFHKLGFCNERGPNLSVLCCSQLKLTSIPYLKTKSLNWNNFRDSLIFLYASLTYSFLTLIPCDFETLASRSFVMGFVGFLLIVLLVVGFLIVQRSRRRYTLDLTNQKIYGPHNY
ncbi:hypothetical protein GmHk_08G021782 [Glycine max]|nr:hypothetical protein GmHk_08G021782 [Glycine max]